jgi:cell division GTPase FtsZ
MAAISSPLLETNITGATGVLISITASEDIQLEEVETASRMIYEEAHTDATIIWGAAFDPSLKDEIRVTIVATGFVDQTRAKANFNEDKTIEIVVQNNVDEDKKEEEYIASTADEEVAIEEEKDEPLKSENGSLDAASNNLQSNPTEPKNFIDDYEKEFVFITRKTKK